MSWPPLRHGPITNVAPHCRTLRPSGKLSSFLLYRHSHKEQTSRLCGAGAAGIRPAFVIPI